MGFLPILAGIGARALHHCAIRKINNRWPCQRVQQYQCSYNEHMQSKGGRDLRSPIDIFSRTLQSWLCILVSYNGRTLIATSATKGLVRVLYRFRGLQRVCQESDPFVVLNKRHITQSGAECLYNAPRGGNRNHLCSSPAAKPRQEKRKTAQTYRSYHGTGLEPRQANVRAPATSLVRRLAYVIIWLVMHYTIALLQ